MNFLCVLCGEKPCGMIMSKEPRDILDALKDDARILGESRMIRDPDPAKITREIAEQVLQAVEQFRIKANLTGTYIARAIGISGSTYTEVKTHAYKGDWQSIILDLDRWLEGELRKEQSPKPTEFVWTRIAQDIQAAANGVREVGCIGLVFGPSGLGKTIALRAVAAETPGSIFISVETASATAGGLVELIARQIRANPTGRYTSLRSLTNAVKDKLKDTGRLLIIDEVHKICGPGIGSEQAINVLRDLHDYTGIPILMSGAIDLTDYLHKRAGKGQEPLAQIRSRIGLTVDLLDRTRDESGGDGEPLFTVEEVRKVFGKSKMRLASDAGRYLMTLANMPDSGGLRTCKYLVILATKANQSRSEILTADMLKAVRRMMVHRNAFAKLEAQIDEFGSQPVRMKVG